MKVTMKLEELNYGDAALWLLKKAECTGTAARILRAVEGLPEPLIRQVLDSIPTEEKNGILSDLVRDNRDRILGRITRSLEAHRLGVAVTDLDLDPDLNLTVTVGSIDAVSVADRFLPKLKARSNSSLVALLAATPRPLWAGILRRFSQEDIQRTAVQMLTQSVESSTRSLTARLERQGIRCRIKGLWAWMENR